MISPIGEKDSEERKHANEVRDRIIKPIVSAFEYVVIRSDEYQVIGQITPQIVKLIVESDLVIADVSFLNSNVFYELALRHITRRPFIHLIREGEKIPFDIKDIRAIKFNLNDDKSIEQAKRELREQIKNAEEGKLGTIQYISILLGDLEIIFHALKYFTAKGLSKDFSGLTFGRETYKDEIIANLDFSDSSGNVLELENVSANRIDAWNAEIRTLHIKNCIINHLDIAECIIDKINLEDSKINIMDASESNITIYVKKRTEILNPDFSGAKILEKIEE